MYAWGSTIHGQLGLGGVEEEHIHTPKELEWFGTKTVIKAALGDNHTLFLTNDGKVYSCGSNDYGQLGHDQPRKRPQLVSGLEAYPIISVACGATHSIALNKWGQIFTWGSDYYGQLGHQLGHNLQTIPKILKTLATQHAIQISAGQYHSIALINNGIIYTWGSNNYGQLGIGKQTTHETVPCQIITLYGIPISLITCGGYHTIVLSKSGTVFCWGKNTNGQLGINDNTSKYYPTQLKTLRNIRVRYICCGEEFSLFLTIDGGVFSCGHGNYGQLGHNTNTNEILPRQVIELMGSTITQIACGRNHSLAFIPSRGRVYSFGLGGSGQLGLRKPINSAIPQVVLLPWLSTMNNDNNNIVIKRIFAGGDHCFVTISNDDHKIESDDFRYFYTEENQILELKQSYIQQCLEILPDHSVDQELLSYLEIVFKSLNCLNASFLLDNDQHYYCTNKNNGININKAELIFSMIGRIENQTIKDIIRNCIIDDIIMKLTLIPPDIEVLRIYLLLPLYYEFNNSKQYLKLHIPFIKNLLNLNDIAKKIIGLWWLNMTNDYFEKLIIQYKIIVIYIITKQNLKKDNNDTIKYDKNLILILDMLEFLNQLNRKIDGLKVPYDTFHINDLNDLIDIRIDYLLWLQDNSNNSGKLFLCNYPFIFDANAKTQLLITDQSIQMHNAMQNAAQQAWLSMLLSPSPHNSIQQYLILNVTREHIVEDALRELSNINTNDLKKPLRVKFCGEEAEDAGGVRKEFFMLVLREILDPKYGMFKEYNETRTIWFSDIAFDDDNDIYFLIGLICGLAIYNFTIIDLPFPLVLYKKLLNEPILLTDLKTLSPTITKSLQYLLDYNNNDVEDVFGLYFELTTDYWGETKTIELKPNGSNIKVTNDNKNEYVNLYINYIINDSVKKQYDGFHNGFMKVCGGRVLKLFHSHELMAVVVGNENYDWHALEEACEYKNGYKSSDQTILWFWEVIHEMALIDKKKFLLFLTGSDRIPIQGMKAIKIIIQPVNDDKCLPVAHTCFNLLDLPRYQTKEKLRYKLMQAIQQTEGFSLV